MRYGDSIAVGLVFCLVFPHAGQDPAALDALFRQAAERESGQGGPKDPAGAARLYEQAARQGHLPSMVRLGYLRQSGEGVSQDQPEAFSLFGQAAKAGNADAKFFLAMSYAEGVGTRKDPVTARNLLLQPRDGWTPILTVCFGHHARARGGRPEEGGCRAALAG